MQRTDPVPVIIFHSTLGLRPVELAAADRVRRAGHPVAVPDLFGGEVAAEVDGVPSVPAGFEMQRRVGWDTVLRRAAEALDDLPPRTVLCGFSMGVGVIADLWPGRLAAAAVLLLHATTPVPDGVAPGTPVQTHVAVGDRFAPERRLAEFQDSVAAAGVAGALFRYPRAGHFFTDPDLPDHDPAAAALAWQRIETVLAGVR
ncbi:dienelactone hydrolase family protein [Microlunatus parietis]|uniref:Dienelactone hydrolase n=1 Tax=Microlunatus parietis TaxID=682979 RepID=A0A7Y9IDP1_9ACTN|nr:dienelactone hydrolase family protein [Microlunatus parietis]NYE74967.1 dienelactone hydrolase [Microlunatus parietis]